jgi:phosphoenolpyruvate carboxykinase (ATP)
VPELEASNASREPRSVEIGGLEALNLNWSEARLLETAISCHEGRLSAHGALAVMTGTHTGRSAQDKFIVRGASTDSEVWWEGNAALSRDQFDSLLSDFLVHAGARTLFAQDLQGGADPVHHVKVRVYCELAWHALFIRHLLIRPERSSLEAFTPQLTIIDLPSFKADPLRHGTRGTTVIACDLERGIVLIGGTAYAGEIKKSVFTVLNWLLPARDVLPMHCSANVGAGGDTVLFFGLSGTGKTTLSADPGRTLVGDDEHGWSEDGVFNFEGGCYAKTIRLSREAEPEIHAATEKFATVLENVVLDAETRLPDFGDGSLTENTRAAYPLDAIANASRTGRAGHPRNIVMLTADAFGVFPPIAKLSPNQAMFHFLSGYTAKVAGTEKGISEPQATFSTCFGAPFLPRHPIVYGNLLKNLIARHRVDCWLVNTGWTGGRHGTGHRMPIKITRALLAAALDGSLKHAPTRTDPLFSFAVPTAVEGVDSHYPRPAPHLGRQAGLRCAGACPR